MFETRQSLLNVTLRVVKYLNKQGVASGEALVKRFNTCYAMKYVLKKLQEAGHVSIERESSDRHSKVIVLSRSTIGEVYSILKNNQ